MVIVLFSNAIFGFLLPQKNKGFVHRLRPVYTVKKIKEKPEYEAASVGNPHEKQDKTWRTAKKKKSQIGPIQYHHILCKIFLKSSQTKRSKNVTDHDVVDRGNDADTSVKGNQPKTAKRWRRKNARKRTQTTG